MARTLLEVYKADWCGFSGKSGMQFSLAQDMKHAQASCPRCGRRLWCRTNIYGTNLGLPRHKTPRQ